MVVAAKQMASVWGMKIMDNFGMDVRQVCMFPDIFRFFLGRNDVLTVSSVASFMTPLNICHLTAISHFQV